MGKSSGLIDRNQAGLQIRRNLATRIFENRFGGLRQTVPSTMWQPLRRRQNSRRFLNGAIAWWQNFG
jgi:hypothetical protein